MRIKFALAATETFFNWRPETILRRMATTIDKNNSTHPELGGYDTTLDRHSCYGTVALYLRDALHGAGTYSISDRILMYGSRATMEPGETAHVCLYSDDGHKRADTFSKSGGRPANVRGQQIYSIPLDQLHNFLPVDATYLNYNLIKSISVDEFFELYFDRDPTQGSIK